MTYTLRMEAAVTHTPLIVRRRRRRHAAIYYGHIAAAEGLLPHIPLDAARHAATIYAASTHTY